MMLAKYGPHRDALHEAFLSTHKLQDDPLELKWTYQVIVAALVAMSRESAAVMGPWIAGPGRTSSHHSGLAAYANKSLKILSACDQEPGQNKCKEKSLRHVVFGKGSRGFLIQPYSQKLEGILMKVRAFGQALCEAKVPKSLEEWHMAMTEMTSVIRTAPGIPNRRCYRYKWIVRGYSDYRRRSAGMQPGITCSKKSTAPYTPSTTSIFASDSRDTSA